MSGVKTVEITASQYAESQRTSRALVTEQGRRREAEGRAEAERRRSRELDAQLVAEQSRQQRTEARCATIEGNLASLERQTGRRLEEASRQLRKGLEAEASARAADSARLATRITQAEEAARRDLQSLRDELDQRDADRTEHARRWQGLVDLELDLVADETMHAHFAPGALDSLRAQRETATGNLRAGMPEASVAVLQVVWEKVRTLRERLMLEEAAWRDSRCRARAALSCARAALEARRTAELVLEGQPAHTYDVDRWSSGALGSAARELDRVAPDLEDGAMPTTEALDAHLSSLADVSRAIEEAPDKGKAALLASVGRRDAAEALYERLSAVGYSHVASGYEGSDERGTFLLHVRNGLGDDLAVEIAPREVTEGFDLRVSFRDVSPNEQIRQERLSGPIRAALEEDLGVSAPPFVSLTAPHSNAPDEDFRVANRVGAPLSGTKRTP